MKLAVFFAGLSVFFAGLVAFFIVMSMLLASPAVNAQGSYYPENRLPRSWDGLRYIPPKPQTQRLPTYSIPNVYGGEDYYDQDGFSGYSEPNVYGGRDFYQVPRW